MATGIVSIAAADHGYRVVSDVLARAGGDRVAGADRAGGCVRGASFDIHAIPMCRCGLCTFVAACAVVGTRLAGPIAWCCGCSPVWRCRVGCRWRRCWCDGCGATRSELRDRAHGAWELASVATSGLAIVTADLDIVVLGGGVLGLGDLRLSADDGADPVASGARFVGAGVGAARRVDSDGRRGDRDAGGRPHPTGRRRWIRPVTVVTWVVATLWILPLIYVRAAAGHRGWHGRRCSRWGCTRRRRTREPSKRAGLRCVRFRWCSSGSRSRRGLSSPCIALSRLAISRRSRAAGYSVRSSHVTRCGEAAGGCVGSVAPHRCPNPGRIGKRAVLHEVNAAKASAPVPGLTFRWTA